MKQLFINIKSVFDGKITNDFGNKAITQINFNDEGTIHSVKCVWIRNDFTKEDLFLNTDYKGGFVNVHGNLIGEIIKNT